MDLPANEVSKPWYKYLWVWLIMLPPLAAVIGGLVTFILAGGPPDLVSDSFGENSAEVRSEINRDGRADND